MGDYIFDPPAVVALAVVSGGLFPVRRIFCVGQNYSEHAREMGSNPDVDPPFFFTKPADALMPDGAAIPYPPATADLQHEVELVVAFSGGGRDIPAERANDLIFGYAVGLDMTRRDLQAAAKAKGRPWDMSKAFDHSAPCGALTRKADIGTLTSGAIECKVNGVTRQSADLSDMIWNVPQIVQFLSGLVEIRPGDLIFTGTPAGVGPVLKGDDIEATIAGLTPLTVRIKE
ncbi:fumarylacetoacetate (FAA) hydrolase [Methylocella silvestris BL2]|uniref:Fumarylacetoacetate (FAA) hydrolase n=1 Tax=Methylocella silvestris (strain DSM 15510 / CIP 108128 / LMG 27833 / NCIMB 13906 / BL2) TaxID=395965 RepID=B8ENE4_METSB|nr:fumarylacetoacetate hydrolase family protein [Methylocella silvestris]ACK50075.1 fumarylacetoacetate (FAA) hydrolase [Methylocella silvestris BL2]